MASVALALVFTWPILVDGWVQTDRGLDQVRFFEDHRPSGQDGWSHDFLDREDGLDQFRGARPRLKSFEQPRPDPGPPNEMAADLGQPGVVAAGDDVNAVEIQFLKLPQQLVRQASRLDQPSATA